MSPVIAAAWGSKADWKVWTDSKKRCPIARKAGSEPATRPAIPSSTSTRLSAAPISRRTRGRLPHQRKGGTKPSKKPCPFLLSLSPIGPRPVKRGDEGDVFREVVFHV